MYFNTLAVVFPPQDPKKNEQGIYKVNVMFYVFDAALDAIWTFFETMALPIAMFYISGSIAYKSTAWTSFEFYAGII